MTVLRDLEPERLWYYFEEISKIPRCSGNEDGIRNFIIHFAKNYDLNYRADRAGNVVVTKDAFTGFEDKPTVILQAHMDMVCEKDSNVEHNFRTDPINLRIVGDRVKADGTTLGADNGIALSAMLALLENKKLKHGKIECLFTVEEETGLKGAMELNGNLLTGRYMINLDSEEAGVIYIGCAGGIESKILINKENNELKNNKWKFYRISITGLKGGHSGGDIDKERANALKLMARLLFDLKKSCRIRLINIKGGDKHNAIPRECFSEIASLSDESEIDKIVTDFENLIGYEYEKIENKIDIMVSRGADSNSAFSEHLTDKLINIMMSIPHGVIKMSKLFDNLVETSTNFAAINISDDQIELHMSHRSSVDSGLEYVMNIHKALADLSNFKITFLNRYPAWQPDTNSKLLKLSSRAMKDIYGKKPVIRAIHAGLEAAIIKSKFKDMEIISIGPTIENPHSPQESVEIKTVMMFWNSLLKILEQIN